MRPKGVWLFQVAAQYFVIVNFAINRESDRTIVTDQRLGTTVYTLMLVAARTILLYARKMNTKSVVAKPLLKISLMEYIVTLNGSPGTCSNSGRIGGRGTKFQMIWCAADVTNVVWVRET